MPRTRRSSAKTGSICLRNDMMKELATICCCPGLVSAFLLVTCNLTAGEQKPQPVTPGERVKLFNGKDLTGLSTWLKDTRRADPRHVFSVTDGQLHISGDGFGYAATEKAYRDYHPCATRIL